MKETMSAYRSPGARFALLGEQRAERPESVKGIATIGCVEGLDNLKKLFYPDLDFAEVIFKFTFYFFG